VLFLVFSEEDHSAEDGGQWQDEGCSWSNGDVLGVPGNTIESRIEYINGYDPSFRQTSRKSIGEQ
jgi:hypothetical protein